MRERALAGLLVAGAFAVVLVGLRSDVFQLEPWLAPKEAALALTALLLLPLVATTWRRIRLSLVDALLSAFVAWSALCAALATNRWLALASLGVGLSGLVVYAAARAVARAGHARGAALGLAGAAAIGAALGVGQAYGLDWGWLADSRAPGGSFGNRNFLAHLAAIAVPLLLYIAVRGRATAAAGALGLAVAVMAIVLTRSRAAWLGAGVAVALMVVAVVAARGRPLAGRGARLILLALLLAGAVAAALLAPNRLQWRSDAPYAETLTRLAEYRSGSGRGRLIQYRNTLEMVREHPVVGVGPGNWFVHYPRYTTAGDPAFAASDPLPTNPWPSSDWVALLAERGVIGMLLLALAGMAAAATAARHAVTATPPPGPGALPRAAGTPAVPPDGLDRPGGGTPPRDADPRPPDPASAREGAADASARATALLGVLAATVMTGLFDAVLLLAAPTYLVWGALGLLLPESRPLVDRPLGAGARRVLLASLLLALGAVTAYAGVRTAAVAVARQDSRASLRRAALLDPGGHRLHLRLATVGSCSRRLPHARRAAALLPHHEAPVRALRACGEEPRDP